jgi:hypothetical protein
LNKGKRGRRIQKPYPKVREWDSQNSNCVNCKSDLPQKLKNKQKSNNKPIKLKQKKETIKEKR